MKKGFVENCEPWMYCDIEFDWDDDELDRYMGFVYLLHNPNTDMKYVGKKRFWRLVKKMRKGKKVVVRSCSDWKSYCGSAHSFELPVEGQKPLKREILHVCKTKTWMSYYEVKEQIERKVLLDDSYANGIIDCKISGNNLSRAIEHVVREI